MLKLQEKMECWSMRLTACEAVYVAPHPIIVSPYDFYHSKFLKFSS